MKHADLKFITYYKGHKSQKKDFTTSFFRILRFILMGLTFVILFNPNSLVMRTQLTFSVLFWIYAKRAQNNLATVYTRITINGRKLNISLQSKVEVNL